MTTTSTQFASNRDFSFSDFEEIAAPAFNLSDLVHQVIDRLDFVDLLPANPPPDPYDTQTAGPKDGTLYVKGGTDAGNIDFDDVRQGGLGDCYLLASLAAVANQNPNLIRNAITENRNAQGEVESYTVRLYTRDERGHLQPQDIKVDAKEFSQSAAQSGDTSATGQEELWVKIVEKAYAQAKGSYGNIGHGGWPEDATEALTGVNADSHGTADRTFADLQADLAAHKPVTVWTAPGQSEAGLVGNHAYAVVGTKIENGQEMVKLYNPWGGSHPGQVDAAGDGGWITMDEYKRLLAGETVGMPINDGMIGLERLFEQHKFFNFFG